MQSYEAINHKTLTVGTLLEEEPEQVEVLYLPHVKKVTPRVYSDPKNYHLPPHHQHYH